MKEKTKRAMNTVCEKDYKGNHYWEKIGVDRDRAGVRYLIRQCSQCGKCISEELDFIIQGSAPKVNKSE